MYRKPLHWAVLLCLPLIACTVQAQDADTNKLIQQIAQDYWKETVLRNDPKIDEDLEKMAKALEKLKDTLDESDAGFWQKVKTQVDTTANSFAVQPVKTRVKDFLQQKIVILENRAGTKKDNLNVLPKALLLVRALKDRVPQVAITGRSGSTTSAASTSGTASTSVPDWYTRMIEHKQEHWEYRAKVRAWRRAAHRR